MSQTLLVRRNMPASYPIEHYRRDTFVFVLDVVEDTTAEAPIDISGNTYQMQVRNARTGDLIVDASTTTGEITLPSTGRIKVQFTNTQNNALTADCKMVYDIQQVDGDGVSKTLLAGSFTVTDDVTHA